MKRFSQEEVQQFRDLQSNPNLVALQNMLRYAEGTDQFQDPSRVFFGGSTFQDTSQHPGRGPSTHKGKTTSAAGEFQITAATDADLTKATGIKGFTSEDQRVKMTALLASEGALQDVIDGNFQSAIAKIGNRWASLPSASGGGRITWQDAYDRINQTRVGAGLNTVSLPEGLPTSRSAASRSTATAFTLPGEALPAQYGVPAPPGGMQVPFPKMAKASDISTIVSDTTGPYLARSEGPVSPASLSVATQRLLNPQPTDPIDHDALGYVPSPDGTATVGGFIPRPGMVPVSATPTMGPPTAVLPADYGAVLGWSTPDVSMDVPTEDVNDRISRLLSSTDTPNILTMFSSSYPTDRDAELLAAIDSVSLT